MEFSKPRLTPASQATFGRSFGKKQKNKKKLKNGLRVMKQILYDMGKKIIFFPQFLKGNARRVAEGVGGP